MRTYLVILACIIPLLSHAQREFSGGFVAGLVSSQISGDGLGGWDKFGFTGGGWVRIPVGDKTGLLMGLVYINKGSRTVDTLTRTTFGYQLDYIEMPLLLDYKSSFLNNKLHGQVGPSVGVNIRQKVNSNGNLYDPNPSFELLDVGIIGGIAYDVTAKYQIALRTSTSFIPTRPAPTVPVPNSFYLKGNYNQTLQLLLSIRI